MPQADSRELEQLCAPLSLIDVLCSKVLAQYCATAISHQTAGAMRSVTSLLLHRPRAS